MLNAQGLKNDSLIITPKCKCVITYGQQSNTSHNIGSNPTHGIITILYEDIKEIIFYNTIGNIVYENAYDDILDVGFLRDGVYIMKISFYDETYIIFKIIKIN
jgi:hypothetical protein